MTETTQVIASAPGDDCFRTVQHSGKAQGRFEPIGGVNTYLAEPPVSIKSKGIMLYYSDVFGPSYINNQLIMDYFASNGFTVAGIDYFFGDSYEFHMNDEGWDRKAWIDNAVAQALACEPRWLDAVKTKFGPGAKYAAVGYCFGAPFVMNAGSNGGIAAGALCHPSRLDEEHFRNIKAPLILCCAETDAAFPLEKRRRAEDILVERKCSYYFQVFSGVVHGFSVRCNLEVEAERFAKEECARGIVSWFNRFLN